MITVEVVKLPLTNTFEDSIFQAANIASEQFAENVRENVKGAKCINHPEANQLITIRAGQGKLFSVEKTQFCCKDFADSIRFHIDG